jgi:hypothetical protein
VDSIPDGADPSKYFTTVDTIFELVDDPYKAGIQLCGKSYSKADYFQLKDKINKITLIMHSSTSNGEYVDRNVLSALKEGRENM